MTKLNNLGCIAGSYTYWTDYLHIIQQ